MGLLEVLRSGVAIANKITRPLQPVVQYERYLGADGTGAQTWASAVPLHAIEDWVGVQVRTKDGSLTVSRASILLLDITEVTNATAGNGIDDNDRFTLADGTTGPIVDLRGFVDAGTSHPIATTVLLG